MADETLVIEIKADTTGLQPTVDLLEKLGKIDAATAEQFRKATASFQAQEKALQGVGTEAAKAGIETEKASKKMSDAAKKTDKDFKDFINTIKQVGAAVGIGLGVAAIIEFGKESLKAFTDAEKTAKVLQTAVGVNGGLQKDFDNLIKQSKELQEITIFSDDDIQKAQTMALQFGLTSRQVENLLPIIADFASATNKSITEATGIVIDGLKGQGRALKDYRIQVDATQTVQQRLATITQGLTDKFNGQAEVVGKTAFGSVERLKNKFNDLQEEIGGVIVAAGNSVFSILDWIDRGFKPLNEELDTTIKNMGEIGRQISKALPKALIQSQIDQFTRLGEAVPQKLIDDLKKINLDEFNNEIQKLDEKTLVKKLDDITKAGVEFTRQGQLTNQDRIAAINEEIKAREAAGKLIKEQNETNGDDAKKAAEEEKKLVDARIKSEEDHFKLAEENLKIFVAERKRLILSQNLSAEEQEQALTNLQFLELQIRKQNYLKYKKDIGEIDNQIADLLIKNQNQVTLNQQVSIKITTKSLHDSIQKIIDDEEKKKEAVKKSIDALVEFAQASIDIFQAQDDARISSLEEFRKAQQDAFDEESDRLKDKLDRDLITQAQYENQLSALRKKKAEDEKRIDAEIKKIKQQQAERDKAFSTFEIIINTAKAISQVLDNPFLVALVAALGAAQLAKVLSTPIPKFHKGKLASLDSSEQHAIIRKDETVVSPENSKQFSETLSAIHNRQISPSILNNFVRMKVDKMPGGSGRTQFPKIDIEHGMSRALRKGVRIKNTNELGKAIADNLPQENIRRQI